MIKRFWLGKTGLSHDRQTEQQTNKDDRHKENNRKKDAVKGYWKKEGTSKKFTDRKRQQQTERKCQGWLPIKERMQDQLKQQRFIYNN